MTPRLSIILGTLNRVELLRRSLSSILAEVETDYPESEVIVIDGGSKDGTAEFLKENDHRLAYWVSEPDDGVAQAANKGLTRARGDVVRLIGDDDEFLPGKLRMMMNLVDALPDYAVVAGHNRVVIEAAPGQSESKEQIRYCGEIERLDMYRWGAAGILIPEGCFFRKSALEKQNGYDESIKWWGFLDLFLRMINAGDRFFVVPAEIMITYQTPKSDTFSNLSNPKFWSEYLDVIGGNAGLYWKLWHQYGHSFDPRNVLRYYRHKVRDAIGGGR